MEIKCGHALLHLWGPLSINIYGVWIITGAIISLFFIRRDKRFTLLNLEADYADITVVTIMAAVFGGRLLEIISNPALYTHHWMELIIFWDGGFSILGSILGATFIVPLYLYYKAIPIIPLFDLTALYAPLLQSIARFGCLFAGCCYGIQTTAPWSVTYTNPDSMAPLFTPLHPTQLYSSLILFCIFLFLFFKGQHCFKKDGHLFSIYLILVSLERFIVDFWRAERGIYALYFSFYQCIALGIIGSVVIVHLLSRLSHSTFVQKRDVRIP